MGLPSPPSSCRRLILASLIAACLTALAPPHANAQPDRRKRDTPGLVLDLGARHGACDELIFTPDGNDLLAAGDDKVVRSWRVAGRKLDADHGRELRWPIFREWRGNIYALALDPHDGGRYVAVAGNGYRADMVAVIDRRDGSIQHALPPQDSTVVWKIAFSPDGRHLINGTDNGGIWHTDLSAAKPQSKLLTPPAPVTHVNRVRLVAFLNATEFVTVAQDGHVLKWNLSRLEERPQQLGKFSLPHLFNVAISPDHHWLAGAGEARADGDRGDKLSGVELLPLAGGSSRTVPIRGTGHYPHCLAFDKTARHLAVGVRVVPPSGAFYKEIGGSVRVFDLQRPDQPERELPLSNYPQVVTFHPQDDGLLATAGGDNHEVCLWDWKAGTKLGEVRGPGACLWGAAFSGDGRYLGFQDRRAADPPDPNHRGAGPWRVFDLQNCRLLPAAPAAFQPTPPLDRADGWSVKFTRNAYVWEVVTPDGTAYPLNRELGLFEERVNNMPRCYAFLPARDGKPTRLVVGHAWGASLYDLDRNSGPRLARVMTGHEGDVMALAVSPDQKVLVTAGRDETLAAFSLADWPHHAELGATFTAKGGKLVVNGEVPPGSPAWEVGLTDGDEVTALVIKDESFAYNATGKDLARDYHFVTQGFRTGGAEQAAKHLADARPQRELVFVWKHQGREQKALTTVRQRPVWKMVPTRAEKGNDWVLWRWRDFYYDTSSPTADDLVGWQVNDPDPGKAPAFYKLEQFKKKFQRPDKVRETLRTMATDPEKVIFADIEPPEIGLSVRKASLTDEDLFVNLSARARGGEPGQQLDRVQLWLNDHRVENVPQPRNGTFANVPPFKVDQNEIQTGPVSVRFLAYTRDGGRAEATVPIVFTSKTRPKSGRLFALCVGVTDYSGTGSKEFEPQINLPAARPGAEEIKRLCDRQAKTPLYAGGHAEAMVDKQVTAKAVLAKIEEIGKEVKSDDWLLLFFAGHGNADEIPSRAGDPAGQKLYKPGTFYFFCADSRYNTAKRQFDNVLYGSDLGAALSKLKCRKFILLDACHSGDVASHPTRDLVSDGVPMLIFSACKPDESSVEYQAGGRHVALFTEALLEATDFVDNPKDRRFSAADTNGDGKLTATELANFIKRRVPEHFRFVKQNAAIDQDSQTPVIFKEPLADVAVFHKP